jgi:hypothetical protein
MQYLLAIQRSAADPGTRWASIISSAPPAKRPSEPDTVGRDNEGRLAAKVLVKSLFGW